MVDLDQSPIAAIRATALQSLIPPPRLKLGEWIESEMRLPEGVSALPGRVKLWPYQREIADAISDPDIVRVTMVKPTRVGFTTLLTGTVASYVANEPAPIMVLLPTDSDCRDYVVSDLEPTFDATPALRGLLSDDADPTGRNTLMSRRFPGGSLKVIASRSPRNLRRHNVRILVVDEADAMEAGAEGSPIRLAEKRTDSFTNRKIIMGSTPTYEDTSNVLRSYAQSDSRIFEVPCPECGAFNEILWGNIEWQPDHPETAAYRCPHCEALIPETRKAAMVDAGRWRALRPEVRGHAGFRLNALVSVLSNVSWASLAAEFVVAKGQPDTLQVFVNTVLAQGWREAADEIDENALRARAEPFNLDTIPPEVLIITVGVDVQRDRLESTFLGWTHAGDVLILGHNVIWGSPADDTPWIDLDDILKTTWPHPNGGTLRVDAAAVDSGDGETTDAVMRFCRARAARRVFAIKGVAGNRPAIEASKTKGGKLFIVGVDGVKSQLLTKLARGRTIRFSASLSAEWFDQLASERRVTRYQRGQPVRQFVRILGRRAEALDTVVYGVAVRQLVSADLDRRAAELATPAVLAPMRKAVIRSSWMER